MSRYVDVDILKKQDFQDYSDTDVEYAIDHCPTADVVEIERLKECPKCVYEYDGEIMEYCVQGPCPNFKTVEQIKGEAYKAFAKRIKQEIKNAFNNNSKVLTEHFDRHEIPNSEFVGIVTGKINTLLGLDDFIDNLLKEMVGEGK